jgi:hypothetical protein
MTFLLDTHVFIWWIVDEGLTLMSDDPLIKQYQVSTFP